MELKLKNYREVLDNTIKNHGDNIAYKYKEDKTAKEPKYITKTYKTFGKNSRKII